MRTARQLLAAGALLLAVEGSAPAAIPEKPGPPRRPGSMIIYGSYIAAGILVAAVCVGAFKSSKRTHQD